MGYVYYGIYAQYYEVSRVETLRKLGITYKEMEDNGIMLPVRDLHCLYHKPARYDDLLKVKARVRKLPGVKMMFEHEVRNQHNVLLNEGSVILVFMDSASQKPIRCPDYLMQIMAPHF
jgi:acyl-CoA thioester hydrolase